MKCGTVLLVALASAVLAAAGKPAPKAELMVLGVMHFDNPGRDIANVKIEDVLTPQRQREINAVVDALARYRPNHVAIEWDAGEQAKLDRRYADYRAGRYVLSRDERDQIGLRLAAKLNLPSIEAADWNQEPPGKDEDYDFPGWLKAHGREQDWISFQAAGQRDADIETKQNRCTSVSGWLRRLADPGTLDRLERPYYQIATFGDQKQNPGAAWVGAWHARNLRILANLLPFARPGDRTIAIFGAGHFRLLQTYGTASGNFTAVDPRRYLPPATLRSCRP